MPATPGQLRLMVRHKTNQITYGKKYEQKCPQLITGSYSCGTKKVNVNVLYPTNYRRMGAAIQSRAHCRLHPEDLPRIACRVQGGYHRWCWKNIFRSCHNLHVL